jgi:hypothetical protein
MFFIRVIVKLSYRLFYPELRYRGVSSILDSVQE